MNKREIDLIIAARDRLTDRRDEQVDWEAVRHFDEVLATVPPGERNDVDLLLGRACAVLPPRTDYGLSDAPEHLHQCGWCGEWYQGARVDHGCPAPRPDYNLNDLADQHEDMLEWKWSQGDLAL